MLVIFYWCKSSCWLVDWLSSRLIISGSLTEPIAKPRWCSATGPACKRLHSKDGNHKAVSEICKALGADNEGWDSGQWMNTTQNMTEFQSAFDLICIFWRVYALGVSFSVSNKCSSMVAWFLHPANLIGRSLQKRKHQQRNLSPLSALANNVFL